MSDLQDKTFHIEWLYCIYSLEDFFQFFNPLMLSLSFHHYYNRVSVSPILFLSHGILGIMNLGCNVNVKG